MSSDAIGISDGSAVKLNRLHVKTCCSVVLDLILWNSIYILNFDKVLFSLGIRSVQE